MEFVKNNRIDRKKDLDRIDNILENILAIKKEKIKNQSNINLLDNTEKYRFIADYTNVYPSYGKKIRISANEKVLGEGNQKKVPPKRILIIIIFLWGGIFLINYLSMKFEGVNKLMIKLGNILGTMILGSFILVGIIYFYNKISDKKSLKEEKKLGIIVMTLYIEYMELEIRLDNSIYRERIDYLDIYRIYLKDRFFGIYYKHIEGNRLFMYPSKEEDTIKIRAAFEELYPNTIEIQ